MSMLKEHLLGVILALFFVLSFVSVVKAEEADSDQVAAGLFAGQDVDQIMYEIMWDLDEAEKQGDDSVEYEDERRGDYKVSRSDSAVESWVRDAENYVYFASRECGGSNTGGAGVFYKVTFRSKKKEGWKFLVGSCH